MALDVSSSIGRKSIEHAKNFMIRMTEIFGVSPDRTGGGNVP